MASSSQDKESLSVNEFPVVGIGASAGGLEAFKRFMNVVPEKSGMAYVFVQHLSPEHESALPSILSKISKIPIQEVTNELKLEPDHLYTIPSNKMLTAVDGVLKLESRNAGNNKIKIIDHFFSSLGVVHQSFAVGVILSGTLNDGSLGLSVVKANGGLTFAQDEESASYADMPKNAVKAGVVDFVLPPEKIVERLIEINHPFEAKTQHITTPKKPINEEEVYRAIVTILRTKRGVDFTYYREPTIKRRIVRRMALSRVEDPENYLKQLKENKEELDLLYNDMLISVTGFFRDPKVFARICGELIPSIIQYKHAEEPFRVWVAGCATGEEAYSIAICLLETLGNRASAIKIQVFATDISEKAIAKARTGIYKKSELEGVSQTRLSTYFTKLDGDYQVNKSVREICIFAQHNFLKDPPFSRVDLVSCRNVMIYLEPILQKKACTTFHFSLKEKGFLVLGKSETVGISSDLFKTYGANDKIYSRLGMPVRSMHVVSTRSEGQIEENNKLIDNILKDTDIYKKADEAILSKFSLPGVLVNEHFEIIQFRGVTDIWLSPSPGKASLNVLKMAREGLSFELRNILQLAKSKNIAVKKTGIQFKYNGESQFATIEAFPLKEAAEPHYLVMFTSQNQVDPNNDQNKLSSVASINNDKDSNSNIRIEQLEKELLQNREDMRNITEEQEAANEELQSANEELLSSGEELQTLNEELETSKEELQSTNEELTIVNHELIDRNEQLNNARKYSESITKTIRDPLLLIDSQFMVKSATEGFYKKFGGSEQETEGKLFFEMADGQWNISTLRQILESILAERGEFVDFKLTSEFTSIGHRSLLLNGRIESINGRDFILLAIEDITDKNKVEDALSALQKMNANLEYSNHELEQFAFIASHDLQEPLRKIVTFSNLIEGDKNIGSDEIHMYLQKIITASRRMDKLIKDLLTFSKASDNTLNITKILLNEVIEDVLIDLELTVKEKKAIINIDELPAIKGIPLHIHQLFYNLINNALKFTGVDKIPVIEIRSKPLSEDDLTKYPLLNKSLKYSDITLTDNGIGFDEEFAEKIFVIFQRLKSGPSYPGTGIGLALCRRIVHNHSGEIFARSKEGEGSEFHVILPVNE